MPDVGDITYSAGIVVKITVVALVVETDDAKSTKPANTRIFVTMHTSDQIINDRTSNGVKLMQAKRL